MIHFLQEESAQAFWALSLLVLTLVLSCLVFGDFNGELTAFDTLSFDRGDLDLAFDTLGLEVTFDAIFVF